MAIRSDPEQHEIRALRAMADLSGKVILEVGCGPGRVTWLYAENAAHVTGIDPDQKSIQQARAAQPPDLADRVTFHPLSIADFGGRSEQGAFDTVILSWAL